MSEPAVAAPSTTENALFNLISERLPSFQKKSGRLNIAALSDALGLSKEGVYKWFRANRISVSGAIAIEGLSKDPITGKIGLPREDLFPFCTPAVSRV